MSRSATTRAVLAVAALLVLLAVVAAAAPPARATSASDARVLLQRNLDKLAHARAAIAAAKEREGNLNVAIEGFDAKLDVVGAQLAAIQAKVDVAEKELARAQKELARLRRELRRKARELRRAEAQLAWQEAVFEQRLVDAYKVGDLDLVDVVLGSTGFDDLVTRLAFVRTLLGYDNLQVSALDTARAVVQAEKRAVATLEGTQEKVEAKLHEKRDQLAALRDAEQAKQDQLLAARQEKSSALAGVAANRRAWEQQVAQLERESRQLASIISGRAGQGHGTGQLIWPVQGTVTSEFGMRVHPIFRRPIMHTGIDIAAGQGTPIYAADGGAVIFAGWMSGYGNTTVVDHGKGISTLYAHQSSIAVGLGATVSRGQTIGAVGSTGYSTGPHLHFEVRVNGEPVNPRAYLP